MLCFQFLWARWNPSRCTKPHQKCRGTPTETHSSTQLGGRREIIFVQFAPPPPTRIKYFALNTLTHHLLGTILHLIIYIFKVIIFCRFLNFYFFYCHVFHYDFEFFWDAQKKNFSQFIHPTRKNVKNISAFCRVFLHKVVRYVLSAKNHEFGYSIIINNSVWSLHDAVQGY